MAGLQSFLADGQIGAGGNTDAACKSFFKDAGVDEELHIVIMDDNLSSVMLAGQRPTAKMWKTFLQWSWSEMIRLGTRSWSAHPTARTLEGSACVHVVNVIRRGRNRKNTAV